MGVRGLQTFLKENRQSLCRAVLLDRDGAGGRATIPVVVDAWGIIYQLYLDALPWASGGEYLRFYRLTRRLVKAWRAAGLAPTFVFDGASPPEKHATQLERMQGHVSTARMFYTISAATRSGPSFSRGSSVLPPFAAAAFARALAGLDVPVKFVPRGEADGACVTLADELGGYVLGKDTDFVVLSAAASDRLKGYCPLDMLEWIEGAPDAEAEADGGSFTTVTTKQRAWRTSRLLPPPRYNNPTLVLATYATPALCRLLRLPASILPLFSSLLGNDYTPANVPELLSAGVSKPSDRIHSVARALREQLDRPRSNDDNAAAELVFRVVRKLCTRPYVNDSDLRELADAIIDATMQYSLPRRDCCSVYPFCGELDLAGCSTSLSRMSTPGGTPPEPSPALKAYSSAQRAGFLNLVTHAWLYPDRVYLWPGLEDPAGPSTRASAAGTAARYAGYAITDEGLGGLRFPAVSGDELDQLKQDQEARKLLGVDENEEGDTESAADSADSDADEGDTTLIATTPPRAVVEYLRQGSSNRVAPRRSNLPAQPESDTPACLKPLTERLGLYLEHLGAKTPAIEALPPRLQPLVAAVRLCVVQAAEADTTGARRWLKTEVEAVLRAGIGSLTGWEALADADDDEAESFDDAEIEYPTLTNRSAELVAQLTAAFTDAQVLAQALLLLPEHGVTHLLPFSFISGVALHTALAGVDPSPSTGWRWSAGARDRFKDAKDAVLDLPDDMFGFTRAPKTAPRSPPRPKAKGRRAAANGRKAGGGGGGSRFDLLSSVEGL
ncbi:hypothetical protein Q8F55_006749 [Vanrija albida]|uniref:Asteroid domain-containing protein n=1 Tax=Vanrija albida TaxID=181172 RepID=A0ABR3PYC9_9TREE